MTTEVKKGSWWRSISRSRNGSSKSIPLLTGPSTRDSDFATTSHVLNNQNAFQTNQHLSPGLDSSVRPRSRDLSQKNDRNKFGLCRVGENRQNPSAQGGKEFPIDIIAVHGLNGGSSTTWTAENKANWIEDFLPEYFPGARIYTFGYDAGIFWNRGTGTISTYARELLEGILNERIERDQKRPIVFICHSMGGIIVKRALNITVIQKQPAYHELRNATKSILFFATPHSGSRIASFGADLATLTLTAVRTDIIKTLQKDSNELYEVVTDFRNLTSKFDIYTFQEMKKIKLLNKLIVTKADATLGVETETLVPMSGHDHRSIVRFQDKDGQDFKLVIGMIRRAVFNAMQNHLKFIRVEDEACLQSLAFPAISDRLDMVKTSAKGYLNTNNWISRHCQYQTWLSSPRKLLWIKGNPGSGKSTLMAFVYDDLGQYGLQSVCLSFFFDRGGTNLQRSQLGMFRSLLQQLYRRSIVARDLTLAAYEERQKTLGEQGKNWEWQLSDVQSLFSKAIAISAQQTEIIVLIDALDEAVDEETEVGQTAKQLVDFFHQLSSEVEEQYGRLKICISSRHYPNVNTGKGLQIVVEEENEDALRKYISTELQLHVEDWSEESGQVQSNLVEVVVRKSNRQFLWASIRVPQVINSLNDGIHSFNTIYQVLESESSKLSDLYENILTSNINSALRPTAFTLLHWIALADRPLSVTELRYALACRDGFLQSSRIEDDSKEDGRVEKLARSLSGGLAFTSHHGAGWKETSVRFIHQTIYEYMSTHGLQMLFCKIPCTVEEPHMDVLGVCEEKMAKSCISYWVSDPVIIGIESWEVGDEKDYHFIKYAITRWTVHAARAERRGRLQVGLVKLLTANVRLLRAFAGLVWRFSEKDSVDDPLRFQLSSSEHLIHIASDHNLPSIVSHLLETGTSVDEDDWGTTALHFAARSGHIGIVQLLLDAGANIQAKTSNGKTPMEVAIASSQLHVARLLLSHGADVNGVSNHGSVLQGAAASGNIALLKFLTQNGAAVNTRTGNGETALQVAAIRRRHAAVVYLVENGADIDANGGSGGSALQSICRNLIDLEDEKTVRYLVGKGANVNMEGGSDGSVLKAAIAGPAPVKVVEILLSKGADIHAVGGEHGTALQAAAQKGCTETTKLLLDAGADPNQSSGYHGSALHAAASSTFGLPALRLLLAKGGDIALSSPRWGSILQAAAYSGTETTTLFLLGLGAVVHGTGGIYGNALHAAICGERGVPMVKLLLDHGADPNCVGAMFGSPLEAAISKKRVEILHLLIGRGANVQSNSSPTGERCPFYQPNYPTYLQIAALKGNFDIFKTLVDAGLDINAHGIQRGNVLSAAVLGGWEEIVQYLFDKGVYIDDKIMNHCLWVAKGNKRLTHLLLSKQNPLDS